VLHGGLNLFCVSSVLCSRQGWLIFLINCIGAWAICLAACLVRPCTCRPTSGFANCSRWLSFNDPTWSFEYVRLSNEHLEGTYGLAVVTFHSNSLWHYFSYGVGTVNYFIIRLSRFVQFFSRCVIWKSILYVLPHSVCPFVRPYVTFIPVIEPLKFKKNYH